MISHVDLMFIKRRKAADMNLLQYLREFIAETPSEAENAVGPIVHLPHDLRRLKPVLLVGVRSPSDQLQVVAIRSCHDENLCRPNY